MAKHPNEIELDAAAERRLFERVEGALSRGRQVYRWWQRVDRDQTYTDRFTLLQQPDRPDVNYGFLEDAPVDGESLPVVGCVQDMFYDQPKWPPGHGDEPALWMRDQVREFMLRYMMRVLAWKDPELAACEDHPAPPEALRPLSWCQGGPEANEGFGYRQLYYKRADTGEIGKFALHEQEAIVDVRKIGPEYEWVILVIRIFHFTLTMPPFSEGYQLSIPFREDQYAVISKDFVTVDESPRQEDYLARYAWGYAFIQSPEPEDSILAYGPAQIATGFISFQMDVKQDGSVWFNNIFVTARPKSLFRLPLNPIHWGTRLADLASFGMASKILEPLQNLSQDLPFGDAAVNPMRAYIRLANLLSGGGAERDLCISEDQMLRLVMAIHFMDIYTRSLGTLRTWNQIRDWTDESSIPEWVRKEKPT